MHRSFFYRFALLCLPFPLALSGCRDGEALKAEQAALEKKITTIEDQFDRMETMVKVERSRSGQLEQALQQARAELEQSRAEVEKLRQAPLEAEAAQAQAKAAAEEPRITGRTIPSVVYKGETYKKVKIHYIHNGEVKVSHANGGGRWKIELFPPDLQPVLLAENQTGDIPESVLMSQSMEPAPVARPALPPALPPVPPVRRPGSISPPPATTGPRLEDEIVPSVSATETPDQTPAPAPAFSRPLPPVPTDDPEVPPEKTRSSGKISGKARACRFAFRHCFRQAHPCFFPRGKSTPSLRGRLLPLPPRLPNPIAPVRVSPAPLWRPRRLKLASLMRCPPWSLLPLPRLLLPTPPRRRPRPPAEKAPACSCRPSNRA